MEHKTFRNFKRVEMPALTRKDLLPVSVSSAVTGFQVNWPVSCSHHAIVLVSASLLSVLEQYAHAETDRGLVRATVPVICICWQVKLKDNLYHTDAQQHRFKTKESHSSKYFRIMKR